MQRMRELREQQHLTQAEVARRAGINPTTIIYIEQGLRIPSVRLLVRLADILQCTTDELIKEYRQPKEI